MLNKIMLSQINRVLFFIVLTALILYFGKEILIVLMFSAFLAMLMSPLADKLEGKGVSEILASLISVSLIFLTIIFVLFIVSAQIAAFVEDIPKIQSKIEQLITSIQGWIASQFEISTEQQAAMLKEQLKNSAGAAGGFVSGLLKNIGSLIGGLILILVFTFLFVLQRNKYERFILKLSSNAKKEETKKIIRNIARVAQQYLKGRVISMILLGIFYTIGFLLLGLENAILLAIIAALLSFIPYVGPLVGGILPVFMVIVTEDSPGKLIGVIVILLVAQAIDNYITEPLVVGGSVNISPFFSIFILILGGAVWGIAGVILFLPMLAMLKIILENIPQMEPYAYLIGDDKKSSENLWQRVKKLFKKS